MNYWSKSLISVVFLFIMLAFAYQQTQAPSARSDTELDYVALSAHVEKIAATPHPMGSTAHREVRDYIVEYFTSLGLATEVQETTVVFRHPFQSRNPTIIGQVENIIARLPGTGEGIGENEDLVLMAHYDSRPDGPGAGDDASGTAAIMEVARIMSKSPAPAHDVVFLVTDGEEMGLLGAQGFFRQHPAAKKAGLVLNFEGRGSSGASAMFESSADNAWLIDNLIESAPDLLANSLTYEIYRRMPNDTDLSISKGEGVPGLNFAFASGLYDYHAMSDSARNLATDTLAQQANYMLATAQHFANLGAWKSASGDKTYFNLWRGTLVSYSQGMAIAIGLAVLLFGLWVFAAAMRAGKTAWGPLGVGFLSLFALLIIVSNVFASLIDYQRAADAGIDRLVSLGEWPLLGYFVTVLGITLWFGGSIKRGLSIYAVIAPAIILAVLGLLAGRSWFSAGMLLLILIPLMMLIRARKSTADLFSAALVLWWWLSALVLYFSPNASYLLIFPLLSVLLGITLQGGPEQTASGNGKFFVALLASFVPLALLSFIAIIAYIMVGWAQPQGLMIFITLSLLLIWPLIRNLGSPGNAGVGLVLLGAGLAVTIGVMSGRGFDARHPRGEELFYAIDVDQQQGYWVSSDARPGTWIEEFLGDDASEANMNRILPGYDQQVLIRETAMPPFKAATLNIRGDRLLDGQRELRLDLHSPANAEYINLLFANDAGISAVTVNGFPVTVPGSEPRDDVAMEKTSAMKEADKESPQDWWRWRWYGLPDQGAEIVVLLEPGRPLPVRVIEMDYGTPAGAPLRPENSMPRSYRWSDRLVVFQTIVLN